MGGIQGVHQTKMYDAYYDAEMLKLIAKSNLRLSLTVRRFLRKATVPVLLLIICWTAWMGQMIWASVASSHPIVIVTLK